MSGGALNYLYCDINQKIETMKRNTPLRRAFFAHMNLISEALFAIEWEDSGDTEEGSADIHMSKCISDKMLLKSMIAEAKKTQEELQELIERFGDAK